MCQGSSPPPKHLQSNRRPLNFLRLPVETRNCSSVLLLKQDCCSQSTTQGTNVNEILWTSSSAAETAVINSQGYFQPTLVRFTQPGSGVIWAEPLCWIWFQECTTNIQRDEPVNYSLSSSASFRLKFKCMSRVFVHDEQGVVHLSLWVKPSFFCP